MTERPELNRRRGTDVPATLNQASTPDGIPAQASGREKLPAERLLDIVENLGALKDLGFPAIVDDLTALGADLPLVDYAQTIAALLLVAQAATEDAEERARAAEERAKQLTKEALTDPLTGLYNRRGFLLRAEEVFSDLAQTGGPATVAIVDLDYFKGVNDTFGHAMGDEVLMRTGGHLKDSVRKSDPAGRLIDEEDGLTARLGGEEFVLMFPDMPLMVAYRRLNEIREGLPVAVGELKNGKTQRTVTASMGFAHVGGPDKAELPQILEVADQALYRAKENGRNRVEGNIFHR